MLLEMRGVNDEVANNLRIRARKKIKIVEKWHWREKARDGRQVNVPRALTSQ